MYQSSSDVFLGLLHKDENGFQTKTVKAYFTGMLQIPSLELKMKPNRNKFQLPTLNCLIDIWRCTNKIKLYLSLKCHLKGSLPVRRLTIKSDKVRPNS